MHAAAATGLVIFARSFYDDDGDVARRARRVTKNAVAADAIRRALQRVLAVRQLRGRAAPAAVPAPDVLVRVDVDVEAEGSTGLHDLEDILYVVCIVLLWTLVFERVPWAYLSFSNSEFRRSLIVLAVVMFGRHTTDAPSVQSTCSCVPPSNQICKNRELAACKTLASTQGPGHCRCSVRSEQIRRGSSAVAKRLSHHPRNAQKSARTHFKKQERPWCSLRPTTAALNMPPKERLTAAQHLAKYGADKAFYVTTKEGANILCTPLPLCKLRGDTRQKVIEYLVCVSDKSGERHALRSQPHQFYRTDEIDDPTPPKAVRVVAGYYYDVPLSRGVLKRSTAAAVDTLIKHSSAIPAVCKLMQLDHKAVVSRPAAINRATPRAWLEHLYCRPSDGLDDRAVKKELIARQKAGKAANLTRELLRRSDATVHFRHAGKPMGGAAALQLDGPAGGATEGVQVFRCPATWSDAQKQGATELLGLSQISHLNSSLDDHSSGLAMTHSRVLTCVEIKYYGRPMPSLSP